MQMVSIFKHTSIRWICVSYIHTLRCYLQFVHRVHLCMRNVKLKGGILWNKYRNLHFDIRHLSYSLKILLFANAHIFLEPHKWMTRIFKSTVWLIWIGILPQNKLLHCNMFIWGLYLDDIFCRRCTRYITPKAWNLFPSCCAIKP